MARASSNLNLCDVILYDRNLDKLVQTSKFRELDKNRYEPIGIVVIPTAHDVYGTGECGVMALMSASLTTPDTGQISNVDIAWGAGDIDYPELNNFNACSSIGVNGTWYPVRLTTISHDNSLPSDQGSFGEKLLNPNGEQSSWYYWSDANQAPSPYNNDGSRNPDYYYTDTSANNVLSDFAGKSNTEFLCSKATKQENWKTDTTIINVSWSTADTAGYHPAACACWRFHTVGTSQGDWYLPACGELGYVCVRCGLISKTIIALQAWSGKTYCPLTSYDLWSSTEWDAQAAYGVRLDSGDVSPSGRVNGSFVRPFLRGRFEFLPGA